MALLTFFLGGVSQISSGYCIASGIINFQGLWSANVLMASLTWFLIETPVNQSCRPLLINSAGNSGCQPCICTSVKSKITLVQWLIKVRDGNWTVWAVNTKFSAATTHSAHLKSCWWVSTVLWSQRIRCCTPIETMILAEGYSLKI